LNGAPKASVARAASGVIPVTTRHRESAARDGDCVFFSVRSRTLRVGRFTRSA